MPLGDRLLGRDRGEAQARGLLNLGFLNVEPVIDSGAIRDRLDEVRPGLFNLSRPGGRARRASGPAGGNGAGVVRVVEAGPVRLEVPDLSPLFKGQNVASFEDRVRVLQDSAWARNTAMGLLQITDGGDVAAERVQQVARRLAERAA